MHSSLEIPETPEKSESLPGHPSSSQATETSQKQTPSPLVISGTLTLYFQESLPS